MTVTVVVSKRVEVQPPTRTYPWLGQSRTTNAIILFTARKSGTLLSTGTGGGSVGQYYENWDASAFDDCHSTITLANKESTQ